MVFSFYDLAKVSAVFILRMMLSSMPRIGLYVKVEVEERNFSNPGNIYGEKN